MTEVHNDPMPFFVIKGKDQLALAAVDAYRQLCLDRGLTSQAIQVARAHAEINEWQRWHPDRVALPEHEHVPAAEGVDLTGVPAAGDPVLRASLHRVDLTGVPAEQALRLGMVLGQLLHERDELLRLLWNVYSRWCVIAGDEVDRHDMDEVCEAVEDPGVTARILEILGYPDQQRGRDG